MAEDVHRGEFVTLASPRLCGALDWTRYFEVVTLIERPSLGEGGMLAGITETPRGPSRSLHEHTVPPEATMPTSPRVFTSPAPPRTATPTHVVLEYLGFRNAPDRREYLLRAQSGSEERQYTVWIAHSAFASRQALLQDGPDICYQKLRRELALAELTGKAYVGVSESDLAHYRETHSPPARRPPSPGSAVRVNG
jgi:hypothetical protein